MVVGNNVVGVILARAAVFERSEDFSGDILARGGSDEAIGLVFYPLQNGLQVRFGHISRASLFVGELDLVADSENAGMKTGDIVLRSIVPSGIEQLGADHLRAAVRAGVAEGIELDHILVATAVHYGEAGRHSFGFGSDDGPGIRDLRTLSRIRASGDLLYGHPPVCVAVSEPA